MEAGASSTKGDRTGGWDASRAGAATGDGGVAAAMDGSRLQRAPDPMPVQNGHPDMGPFPGISPGSNQTAWAVS